MAGELKRLEQAVASKPWKVSHVEGTRTALDLLEGRRTECA